MSTHDTHRALPHGLAPGALRGIKVLDFSAMIAGPYCARWLADLGADVVKVEALDGDHMRHRPPLRDGSSSFFGHLNNGKRCITLDLKQPQAARIALDLACQADVLVEAFRPGVMNRLGLGADAVREANPRLVYCSISGFGQASPVSDRPAYAPVIHSASGYYMANFDSQDGADRPPNSSIPMADMLTAIFASLSVVTALLDRQSSGRGTHIDVNLMDSVMNVMAYEFQAAQFQRPSRRPVYKPMRAQDGFVLVTPINARNFHNLCQALGHPEWLLDPLLSTDQARFENWSEYMRRIEAWTSERSAHECEAILTAAGVPCSRYRRIEEAMRDEQFRARESFAPVSDEAGTFLATRLPFAFDGMRPSTGGEVRGLGADTAEVLRSWLGLGSEDVAQLVSRQAVAGN